LYCEPHPNNWGHVPPDPLVSAAHAYNDIMIYSILNVELSAITSDTTTSVHYSNILSFVRHSLVYGRIVPCVCVGGRGCNNDEYEYAYRPMLRDDAIYDLNLVVGLIYRIMI